MKDKGVKKVYIVGGTSVVSSEVEAQLQEAGITVERIAGETAYDTSAKLATKLIALGMSANNMAIATGWGYTDALAGAALCGKQNSVMVLADNTNQTAINDVVAANKNAIQNYYIFGGTSVVGDGTTDALKGVFTGKDA
ncbi:N-acetylmuramoyl-L-alanine amidase LytC precursor [Chlamydia trachomatis]|nr:N-acetylmuramoyl-L-alanine amidase LytC precursor [Chlamydia trachomatis]